MERYKKRIADSILQRKLQGKGAVLVEGPKWCGKTTTAKQQAKSALDLGDTSVLRQSAQLIEINPQSLLDGETPRLIDEWQTLPSIWDSIRSEVDRRGVPAQSSRGHPCSPMPARRFTAGRDVLPTSACDR